jgi:peptide/nickel transport system permease protein
MPPLLRFIIYRLISIPLTLVVITLTLYGFVMLTPPEVRASMYFPEGFNPDRLSPDELDRLVASIIQRRHLDDPFPVQYALWAGNLARGEWGWSPVLKERVLPALIRRTPVTAELTLYSLLVTDPLGILSGVVAGSQKDRRADHRFRLTAFVVTSMPPFILAILLMAIFYVMLHWFPPGRISTVTNLELRPPDYQTYTGLLTIDGPGWAGARAD